MGIFMGYVSFREGTIRDTHPNRLLSYHPWPPRLFAKTQIAQHRDNEEHATNHSTLAAWIVFPAIKSKSAIFWMVFP